MTTVRAALLCDGKSDRDLSSVVERVAAALGYALVVEVVDFSIVRPGLSLTKRLQSLPELVASPAVFLIHRDAEAMSPVARITEISDAMKMSQVALPHVPVVPVTMTEAWLLCDETAIRDASGNPKGRRPLHLPKNPEAISDPKETLKTLILDCSEQTGRRRT